jgi:hypothetical protein
MKIYGPRGTKEMADHFHAAFKWDLDMRDLVGIPMAGSGIEAHDVGPGVIFDKDGLKITAFEVEHMPIDVASGQRLKFADGSEFYGQTLGYRIDYMGHSVLFSGDTRSTAASQILQYGKGVDVLIHEVQVPSKGGSKEARLANMSLSVHSTPEQAGTVFAKTKPRMAVYNHIIPPDTDPKELIGETRPVYAGPLTVGEDFMTITIGDTITIGEQARGGTHVFEKSSVVQLNSLGRIFGAPSLGPVSPQKWSLRPSAATPESRLSAFWDKASAAEHLGWKEAPAPLAKNSRYPVDVAPSGSAASIASLSSSVREVAGLAVEVLPASSPALTATVR